MMGIVRNQFLQIDLDQLFREVMEALTGRKDVVLHFAPSPSKGALASVMVDPAGRPVVYIDYHLSIDAIYELFLHEAAHVVKHAQQLPRSSAASAAPGSIVNHAREAQDPAYMRNEDQAHELQASWASWAEKNTWRITEDDWRYQGFHPVILKLLALKRRG